MAWKLTSCWSLLVLSACCAKQQQNQTRGFLLAATRTPIERLRQAPNKYDDLGALLRDVCATPYPARLVVSDETERVAVERKRPCDRIEAWVLPAARRRLTNVRLRYFKVAAVAANARLYLGGTLYIDNDIALKRSAVSELFGLFDKMVQKGKDIGVSQAHICAPKQHHLGGVNGHFCERNSGVILLGGPKAAVIASEWLHELQHHTSADGHDQMPLRKVLWGHKNDIYDVPKKVQCRSQRSSPCDEGALVWHWHRADRVKWAAKKKAGAEEVCGFVV